MRKVWITHKRPARDIPDEDLFPPERVRREQVRTLRAAIRQEPAAPITALPPRARAKAPGLLALRDRTVQHEQPILGSTDTQSATESIRTVTPIVLESLPLHNFVPVVLPENLRDPMGNFMLHVSGRHLLLFFLAMLFTGAGLFAAGFFLHRSTTDENRARLNDRPFVHPPATPALPKRSLAGRSQPSTTGERAAPPQETLPTKRRSNPAPATGVRRAPRTTRTAGQTRAPRRSVSPIPGTGTRVQVGDIPVFVK